MRSADNATNRRDTADLDTPGWRSENVWDNETS